MSAYDNTILATTGLTNYWPLNEASGAGTVSDLQGGVNSTLVTSLTQGVTGGCVDGSNAAQFAAGSRVTFASNPLPTSGNFTIEFAIDLASYPGSNSRVISDAASIMQFILRAVGSEWGLTAAYDTNTAQFPTGAWALFHAVITSGGNAQYYVNGTSVFGPSNGVGYTSGVAMFFGDPGASITLAAKLQKIAFYNTNLSTGTITAHNTAFTTLPGGLLVPAGFDGNMQQLTGGIRG